jgi:hypothetical protein
VAYKDIQGVTLSGCWAHARRYYVDAIALLSPMERKNVSNHVVKGLKYCNDLFHEENRIQNFSPEERHAARKVKSQRILDEYFAWAEETHEKALPKSPLGKAVGYSVNQKEHLIEFMNNGSLEISNNRAERAVKPFVIGRKNWLFSFTKTGASASSTLYSIMETAKANGLDPFRYMKHLFETLPNVRWEDETVDTLLPWNEEIQRICGL